MLAIGTALLLGGIVLHLINEHAPHEHFILGREGPISDSLKGIWLFVIAITLHNFPEGLAVGVGYGAGDLAGLLGITAVTLMAPRCCPGASRSPRAPCCS